MSTNSATPPATRRIARSYLTDLVKATPLPRGESGRVASSLIAPVVEQLLERAVNVRHVLRSDQLVLTFDLADDPAGWTTPSPAAALGGAATGEGDPWTAPIAGNVEVRDHRPENADYPGQPGERADQAEQQRQEQLR